MNLFGQDQIQISHFSRGDHLHRSLVKQLKGATSNWCLHWKSVWGIRETIFICLTTPKKLVTEHSSTSCDAVLASPAQMRVWAGVFIRLGSFWGSASVSHKYTSFTRCWRTPSVICWPWARLTMRNWLINNLYRCYSSLIEKQCPQTKLSNAKPMMQHQVYPCFQEGYQMTIVLQSKLHAFVRGCRDARRWRIFKTQAIQQMSTLPLITFEAAPTCRGMEDGQLHLIEFWKCHVGSSANASKPTVRCDSCCSSARVTSFIF